VSLAALLAYGGVLAVFWIVVLVLRLDRRTYLAPLVFGNTGNVGLPLAVFAFGAEGLGYAVVIFAVMAMLAFTLGIWLVAGGGSPMKAIKEPMVPATLLGSLFLWRGWETPVFLTNTLDLIGQLAIPLMLVTLGVAVARLTPGGIGRAIWLSALKAILCVGVAFGVGVWFELPHIALAVLVLQVATPVAVTSYLLAEKYEADADAVAGLVVISTLMAIIVIPLVLAVFV
jgi:predicted permease